MLNPKRPLASYLSHHPELPPTRSSQHFSMTKLAAVLGVQLGTIVLSTQVAHAQESESEVSTIESITVHGKAISATEPYAGGQITAGGRVGMLGEKGFMETPFATIGYTEEFIADQQAQDITDVISSVDPTVFSSGITGQNLESYSIRGFRSDISDVTFGGLFGIAPYYRSSPEMFERIDVLKGPSALLNGMPPKGSVGGAVNLVPKRAGETPTANITTTYMSDSQFGGHVDLARRLGDNNQFGIRFNGVFRDGESSVEHQDKKNQLASLGLDWRGVNALISADFYISEERVDGPTRGITLAPGVPVPTPPDPETLLNPSWAFNDSKDRGAMIRGEFTFNDAISAYAAAGASRTKFKSTSATVAQVINSDGDLRTNLGDVADNVKRTSADVGVKSKFNTGVISHQLTLNSNYYDEQYKLNARRNVLADDWITNIYDPVWGPSSDEFIAPPIMKTDTRLVSYGLADTLSFAQDQVQLTLGLRHQNVKQDSFFGPNRMPMNSYDESALTPAIALLYKPSDQLSLFANYIEGLSKGAAAPLSADNAGEVFEPFKTKQKEIGFKLDLDTFTHTASIYEIIRPSSYTDPTTNVFSFGGEQRNRGVEWGFFGTVMDDFSLTGGIAYVDPKLTKTAGDINQGNQAPGIPKLQAKLGIEWDVPSLAGLSLSGNANAMSKQYIANDNDLSLAGHTIYDIGARYESQVLDQSLTWRVKVKNVTNKAYWTSAHYTSLGLGAPRTVMLSATLAL